MMNELSLPDVKCEPNVVLLSLAQLENIASSKPASSVDLAQIWLKTYKQIPLVLIDPM